jgi:hypothetical protein
VSLCKHLILSSLVLLLPVAAAQAQTATVLPGAAVGGPTASQVVTWQDQRWWLPLSADFLASSARLQQTLQQHCAGGPVFPARQAWRELVDRWGRVSALSTEPLQERGSAQRIDAQPLDEAVLAQGIELAAQGAPDLSALAPGGRGLAALEWLLWSPPRAKRGSRLPSRSYEPAACRLAVALSGQVQEEARALSAAFRARASDPLDAEGAMLRLRTVTTQWVAGLEQLRMQSVEAPLAQADELKLKFALLPRGLSGGAPADRLARWTGLRGLLVQDGVLLSQTAATRALSVAAWLKGLGRVVLARQLQDGVQQVDLALRASIGNSPDALRQLSEHWQALAHLVQEQVIPVMDLPLAPALAAEPAGGAASDRAAQAAPAPMAPAFAAASAAAASGG